MKRLITAALLGLLLLPGATPASAAPSAEWTVTPVAAEQGDERVSLRHTLEPGASVSDAIVVTNLGTADARFTVAAGDGVVADSGAFDIARDEPVGGGAWVTVGGLDAGELALAAGESRELPVAIAVPADATPGDHPAGIVVGVSEGDGASTVTTRLGVRVHLRVAGEVAPQLRVTDVGTSFTPSWIPFAPGRLTVDFTVENVGNVRLGGAAELSAAGPFGLGAAAEVEPAAELLPGDAIARQVTLEVVPLGMIAGQLEVGPLTLGSDEVALPETLAHDYRVLAVSWTGMLAVVLAVGAVVLVARRGRAA